MSAAFVIFIVSNIVLGPSQQKLPPRLAAGETVAICGVVTALDDGPERCDASLRIRTSDENFTALIPASIRRTAAAKIRQLRAAEACFKGVVELMPDTVRIRVADLAAVRVLKPAAASTSAVSDAADFCDLEIVAPRVLSEVKPRYTEEAMRARIEGSLTLEAVVLPTGMVGIVRVIKSLDPGLDEQAIKALRQWRFAPGTRSGKAVPVLVSVEMSFVLRSRR
jgi:TonB family protein